MSASNIEFKVTELPAHEISEFFKIHDNDYFEKLSDRIDIDEYSEKLLENSILFTLRDNVNLIGLSPCYFNNIEEKVGYISSLTIKDGYRGKKLGTELINRIYFYAKQHGFSAVVVKIHYLNKASHSFYKKNGFTDFVNDEKNGSRLLRLEVN